MDLRSAWKIWDDVNAGRVAAAEVVSFSLDRIDCGSDAAGFFDR